MFNKFTQSQSTILSASREPRTLSSQKDTHSTLKNPFREHLPLKFPKNMIVKPCERNMLTQTTYFPAYSVKIHSHYLLKSMLSTTEVASFSTVLSRYRRHRYYRDIPNICLIPTTKGSCRIVASLGIFRSSHTSCQLGWYCCTYLAYLWGYRGHE